MFNYKTCTDEELLEHIACSSAAAISVAKRYHESKGNFDVVERINNTRQKLKKQRIIAKLEELEEMGF